MHPQVRRGVRHWLVAALEEVPAREREQGIDVLRVVGEGCELEIRRGGHEGVSDRLEHVEARVELVCAPRPRRVATGDVLQSQDHPEVVLVTRVLRGGVSVEE